jgi:hypothetical protein
VLCRVQILATVIPGASLVRVSPSYTLDAAMGLCRLDGGAVHFHRHASVQHDDRDHEEAFGGVPANKETLDVHERTARDTDPLAGGEVGIRKDRQVTAKRLLDRGDVRIWHYRELVPSLSENRDEATGPSDLDVARLVHGAPEKQISWKHRRLPKLTPTAAPGPRFDLREEHLEAFRLQPIMYELFAVAARPESVPCLPTGVLSWDGCYGFWQGFAPFGSDTPPG